MIFMISTIFKRDDLRDQIPEEFRVQNSKKEKIAKEYLDEQKIVHLMKSHVAKFKYVLLETCILLVLVTMLVFSVTAGTKFRETINYLRLEKFVMYSLILAIFWELLYFIFCMYLSMSGSYKLKKSKKKVTTLEYSKMATLGANLGPKFRLATTFADAMGKQLSQPSARLELGQKRSKTEHFVRAKRLKSSRDKSRSKKREVTYSRYTNTSKYKGKGPKSKRKRRNNKKMETSNSKKSLEKSRNSSDHSSEKRVNLSGGTSSRHYLLPPVDKSSKHQKYISGSMTPQVKARERRMVILKRQ
jgi:hypothetical protein